MHMCIYVYIYTYIWMNTWICHSSIYKATNYAICIQKLVHVIACLHEYMSVSIHSQLTGLHVWACLTKVATSTDTCWKPPIRHWWQDLFRLLIEMAINTVTMIAIHVYHCCCSLEYHWKQVHLVGGFQWFPPFWKLNKSIGIIIPNIWKKKMFQTTNQSW